MKSTRGNSANGVANTPRAKDESETLVRAELVDAAMRLLETHQPKQITTTMLLKEAGVARGSLYYHFSGIDELIERATIEKFSEFVTRNIARMQQVVRASRNREEFLKGLDYLNETTHSPGWMEIRRLRARIIALAERNPRLQQGLALEQDRLTNGIETLVIESQKKGYVDPRLNARALAVFMQAYTFGRILDDIAATRIDPKAWVELLNVMSRGFIVARPGTSRKPSRKAKAKK